MNEELICDVCEKPVEYNSGGRLYHAVPGSHPAVLRVAVPFPAGSKALSSNGNRILVLAAERDERWVKYERGGPSWITNVMYLRPVPVKIAEPPVGSVVWDGDVPWMVGTQGRLEAVVDGRWRDRRWSDMPDTVVLAVPPGGDR
ncbi:MAG: hypothetical protein ACYCZR_05050 [Burkholderiales bacterium]